MGRIDLHMHSDISLDGSFAPEELARLCGENGLAVAALTDHNSVRGVARMTEAARAFDVRVIPAVELDCTFLMPEPARSGEADAGQGRDLHLLGYGIDIEDSRFSDYEKDFLAQKRSEGQKTMAALHGLGLCFDDGRVLELAKDGIVVGEMIAEAALADERNRESGLLKPYLPGGERSDNPYVNFYWDFCSQGKPAFFPSRYLSFEQAADLIRETGGIAVIAHPALTVGRDEKAIAYMAEYGVKGIEVYSSYHTPDDREYFGKLAETYGLFKTMGSDFHGKTKPAVRLGGTGAGREAEEELPERLSNGSILNGLWRL